MVNYKFLSVMLIFVLAINFASAFNWSDANSAYYKLDETTGTIVINEVGTNGTNNLALINLPGILDTAYGSNGTANQRVNSTLPSDSLDGAGDNYSLSFWINHTGSPSGIIIGNEVNAVDENGDYQAFWDAINGVTFSIRQGVGGANQRVMVHNQTANVDIFNHYVLTYDGSTNEWKYYVNGELGNTTTTALFAANDNFLYLLGRPASTIDNIIIDEIGTFGRVLSEFNVLELYNNGMALPFGQATGMPIVLISPANNSVISDVGTNFTVIGDVSVNFNTTNITYFVWDNNSVLHNQTTITLSPSQFLNETLFINNLTLGNYIWTAEVCFENSTFSNCTFSQDNSTFDVNVFAGISLNYAPQITEGALNIISRTITVFPGSTLTGAFLEYNGTNFSTSLNFVDGIYQVGASLVAPTVEMDTNFTFIFYYLIDGVYYSSAEANQTVLNTLFGICGGLTNDTLLNLSLLDEQTRTNITGDIEINAAIISLSSNEVVGFLNGTFSNVDNISICFTPPSVYSEYYLNAEIRYTSTGYSAEFYNIQRSNLTLYPRTLDLFPLNLNDSTEFTITYKNNDFIFTEGAIIQLQRKYISTDTYEVVEAPITGNGGSAVLHIDLNTNIYRASVVKDGVLLDFFENIVFSCDNELAGDCTHSLDGTVNPNNDIPIEDLTDFSYTVMVDEDNQTVTVLFSVPSGTPSTINVLLEQIDMFGNLTSCNTTVVTSAGSITCGYVDTIEKSIIELSISKDGVELAVLNFVNDPPLDMDGMNFFFVFMFMISLVGMAIASPEWMIIISIMVLMISGMLLLVQGMSLVMGLGAIAWVIVAAAIIIMKMSKQEDR